MVPENWLASTVLKIFITLGVAKTKRYIIIKTETDETYKKVRFLKFCNPVGKVPDKLFAQSELQEKSTCYSHISTLRVCMEGRKKIT